MSEIEIVIVTCATAIVVLIAILSHHIVSSWPSRPRSGEIRPIIRKPTAEFRKAMEALDASIARTKRGVPLMRNPPPPPIKGDRPTREPEQSSRVIRCRFHGPTTDDLGEPPAGDDPMVNMAEAFRAYNNRKRVYICGPITGQPDLNKPAFSDAYSYLHGLGYKPISPHSICADIRPEDHATPHEYWAACMRPDITEMLKCDLVAVLHDADKSRGATIEIELAINLGIPVMSINDIRA